MSPQKLTSTATPAVPILPCCQWERGSISFLSGIIGSVPSEAETVISQLARTVYGDQGIFYLAIIAFADFLRLGGPTRQRWISPAAGA